MPTQAYFHFEVQFLHSSTMTEEMLRELIESYGFSIANFSYHMGGERRIRHHAMVLRTTDRAGIARLAEKLADTEAVHDFRIVPAGD